MTAEPAAPPDFLPGGGEMGARVRAHDWGNSPLGAIETWSSSLRMMVSFLLANRFPLLLWWGPEYISIYNDAYRPILGNKHPRALGQPVRECWSEIWNVLEPLIDKPFSGGPATWMDDLSLEVNRYGFVEETHFTIAYSPVPDETTPGGIGGVLATVHEITGKVIGERRVAALRDLGTRTGEAKTPKQACVIAAEMLANYPRDIPFALLYFIGPDGKQARLAGAAGIGMDAPASPLVVDLEPSAASGIGWPLIEAVRSEATVVVENLGSRFDRVPPGPWSDPPHCAAIVPIRSHTAHQLVGLLVAGVSARLRFDGLYRTFFELVATQIATTIANARAYEEERRRAEALAELDRAKTMFFSNISHEFRTPLTLLLGPLEETLATDALPPEQAERLTLAHRNGLRLLKLVNSLLDFSRIEAGRVQARFAPLDLATLTAELASVFRSATERAGLRLDVAADPLPAPVFVDRDMWETVVLNLLSNAFKFTFQGSITVSLYPSADGRAAELEVRDTGTGIAPHELPRLFERFHRIEGAEGRSYEGSGIGLALVQELVRMHGGTIRVESGPGEGSRFIVAIPFGSAHLPPEQVAEQAPAASSGRRVRAMIEEALRWLSGDAEALPEPAAVAPPAIETAASPPRGRVLVADDNADMRDYLRRLLTEQGYDVTLAADGQAALAAARAAPPDLLLADVMMPRLDGFGLLRAVRGDAALAHLPVVLLSARAGEEARVGGLQAGADDYLIKPFSSRELLARIGAYLSLARLRRQATESLRARSAELEAVLQTVPAAVWFTDDRDARIIHSNRPAAAMLGLAPGVNPSFTGPDAASLGFQTYREGKLVPPEMLPLRRAARGEAVADELLEVRFADGRTVNLFIRARTLRDAKGMPSGAVAAAIDVTKRERDAAALRQSEDALRRLTETLEARVAERTDELAATNRQLREQIVERERVQARLHQMQRLEAVGQLTAGAAHDFNNLLTVVLGNIQFLERGADERTRRRLGLIREAAERGACLTAQLLAFSRRQKLAPKPVDLNEVIGGMGELMRSTIGATVWLETALNLDLWPALVDPTQLELVVLNLAINARDAMPSGGSLTVATANVPAGSPLAPEGAPPGEYVMVAVSDTGTGMSEAVRARAFETLFTTKAPGEGSGLGLPQVWGFAQQSGGDVTITSREGEGTSVRVYLPRASAPAQRVPALPPRVAVRGQARILLVDDDAAVREVTASILRDSGYGVVEAGSGGAALDALDTTPAIDLLLVDFAMPGMTGAEVAREARTRRPGLPVLFITGYQDEAGLAETTDAAVVQKPFRDGELARMIEAVLGRAGPVHPPPDGVAAAP